MVVHAVPLRDVTTATSALIRALLIAGGGVLLLGGAATWWTVRGAMRPVDEMVETAEAIAAGDLTRRVPDLDPGTELGRLGGSLNEMLVHIEEAVDIGARGPRAAAPVRRRRVPRVEDPAGSDLRIRRDAPHRGTADRCRGGQGMGPGSRVRAGGWGAWSRTC